jgi:hypothetical protein
VAEPYLNLTPTRSTDPRLHDLPLIAARARAF